MTTATWTTVIDHSTDVAFRAWGSELSANLAAVGMVQTADTGQINWSTVTRAGTTSDAGYEIWRFNDTQQSTSPIFLKLFYGTGATTSTPRLGYQISSVTNGAGVVTGGQNTAPYYCYSLGAASASTSRISYLSYSDGFFALFHKIAGYNPSATYTPYVIIARTVNSTQTPTANGAAVYWQNAGSNYYYNQMRFLATASNTQYITSATWSGCYIPGANTTSSIIPTNPGVARAFPHFSFVPDVLPLIGICTVNTNDNPGGSTFTSTLFGSTSRTYLSLGYGSANGYPPQADAGTTTNYGVGILWE